MTYGANSFLHFVALAATRSWNDAPWERGRLARTRPGAALALSPTCIHRQRHQGSPAAWPMGFPTKGRLPAASHGNSAAPKETACGRDARAPRPTPPQAGSDLPGDV